MKSEVHSQPLPIITLIILLTLLGLRGSGGDIAMLIDPSGQIQWSDDRAASLYVR